MYNCYEVITMSNVKSNPFQKRLNELLNEYEMTYAQLSQKLDINKSTISMWSTGQVLPKAETLLKLSDFFHVSPAYLMGAPDRGNDFYRDDIEEDITIDTDIDKTHPVNIILEKEQRGEKLTPEERVILNKHIQDAIKRFPDTLKKAMAPIKEYYSKLNAEGQKRAEQQVKQAVEQIEQLTEIPKYQKKPDEPPQE